jgi:DDE_Tnp_1-associated
MRTTPSNLLDFFDKIKDPRRSQGRRHELRLILLLTLMSVMSNYIGYRAIGDFIKRNRKDLLATLKPNKDRLPSFDVIRQVLMHIDFEELSNQFYNWAKQYITISDGEWMSMDGKTIGGTVKNSKTIDHEFTSLIALFCSRQKLILATALVTSAKESEIPVVKQLVTALDLEGVTFTLDALHCQKKQLA